MSNLNTYVKGIDNNAYHADKGFLSSSQLKKAVESHGTFRYEMSKSYEDKKWDKNNPMDLGSLVHCLLLEPEMLDKEFGFIDIEGRSFRTNVDKAYLAQSLAHHEGKIVLSNCRKKVAQEMAASALRHPFLAKMLSAPGEAEMSGYYRDDFYGIDLRFRPDRKIFDLDGKPAILDLKTTRNLDVFIKDAKWDRDYDLSAHMYIVGNEQVTGEKDVPFYFGVVESVAPYRVAVYKCSEKFLEQGKRKYNKALGNVVLAKKIQTPTIRYQEVDFEEI